MQICHMNSAILCVFTSTKNGFPKQINKFVRESQQSLFYSHPLTVNELCWEKDVCSTGQIVANVLFAAHKFRNNRTKAQKSAEWQHTNTAGGK